MVNIHASESVVFEGELVQGDFSRGVGGVSSIVESGSSGDAGKIEIDTASLTLTNGAFLATSTLGESDAGSITAIANTFETSTGGRLLSTTTGNGAAGNIVLQVQDSITLAGENSGIFASTDAGSTGNGGSIFIAPQSVTIRDGAEISVNSQGTGIGGNIFLQANSLTIDRGSISAETARETGGNITLEVPDLLLLRRDSNISTNAGTALAGGDGGNITIDTQVLIALLSKPNGSDITANAFEGQGGRIDINAQGVFGLEERKANQGNQTNDIDASSELGTSGEVQLNRSLDPSRGLVELPETVLDPATLIAQNPCNRGRESEFVIAGRGGLPPSPNDILSSEATGVGLVEPAPISSAGILPAPTGEQNSAGILPTRAGEKTGSTPSTTKAITPAQGWIFNNKGEVVLTAYNPTVTGPQRLRENLGGCPTP